MDIRFRGLPLAHLFVFFSLSSPAFADPVQLPARLEAEAFSGYYDTTAGNSGHSLCATGDVDAERTGDTDGFCNLGWTRRGEWTEYHVSAPRHSRYDLILRAASGKDQQSVQVQLDGVDVAGAVVVPKAGWQNYNDLVVPVEMSEGEHRVRIIYNTGSVNLNYLNFVTTWSAEPDEDGDGVADGSDACPSTTSGAGVDSSGCSVLQRDDDSDGIVNAEDTCPTSPVGQAVNSDGCSSSELDDDGDGINNSEDLCPQSYAAEVTAYGCDVSGDEDHDRVDNRVDSCPWHAGLLELGGCLPRYSDFDADNINDEHDQCPYSRTPAGANGDDPHWRADASGCSMADRYEDDDGDGISNGFDRCPVSVGPAPISNEQAQATGLSCFGVEAKDDDLDGIINGLDLCPQEFGEKSYNGCINPKSLAAPHDLDDDAVPNAHDHCPFSPADIAWQDAGSAPPEISANGCWTTIGAEDHDRDGIANSSDHCPHSTLGHLVDSYGCTGAQSSQRADSDGDSVRDALDLCDQADAPEVGLLGCTTGFHDSDFDGLPDDHDLCRFDAGLRLSQGCPAGHSENHSSMGAEDTDYDGVLAIEDACPYSQRSPYPLGGYSNGCFANDYSDFDADGVINGQDFCPNTAESAFIDAQGCSDYDRLDFDVDGVINGLDLCPRSAGAALQNGCSVDHYDSDADGTPNEFDQCRNTPRFARVLDPATGCADDLMEDDDGDGIHNGHDQCPHSDVAISVSDYGCTFMQEMVKQDHDQDGVGDAHDFCPGTEPQQNVDTHGCPTPPSADSDGDNVPNDYDRCDNTAFAVAMDSEGCEIVRAPAVGDLSRPFGAEGEPFDLHITREDLTFADNRHLDLLQPLQFEVGPFSQQHDIYVGIEPEALSIHVPPHMQNTELRIPLRVKLTHDAQVSNWFTLSISARSTAAALGTVIINDLQVLEQSGISLSEVLRLMAGPVAHPDPNLRLFRQLWDSQRSHSVLGLPYYCEGQINGFPIVCDRPETELVFLDDLQLASEMHNYRLTAVVNRLDKHRQWQDCGEQRLVFGLRNTDMGRKFINVEARLPNPQPGSMEGCRPVVDFWQALAALNPTDQSSAIFAFFYGGRFMSVPVISPEHFLAHSGQLRSSQFAGGEWLFKEHKLERWCSSETQCEFLFRTVSVKENPFGELFNPQTTESGLPWAETAREFQQTFAQNLTGLTTTHFVDLANPVGDRFNHGQSHGSGPLMVENDYLLHFGGQYWSDFGQALMNAVFDQVNANGSALEVEQVLSRASGLTCAGCHAPESFGLTHPGRIGVMTLPNGKQLDAWPMADFVHIDEQGQLSPAMENVFLPARQAVFQAIVEALR